MGLRQSLCRTDPLQKTHEILALSFDKLRMRPSVCDDGELVEPWATSLFCGLLEMALIFLLRGLALALFSLGALQVLAVLF